MTPETPVVERERQQPPDPEPVAPPASTGGPGPDVRRTPPETPKADAVAEVAKKGGDKMPAEIVADATDWFLADDDEEEASEHTFEMNVGVGKEHWVSWTVRALDRDRIRDLRKMSTNRATRRSGGGADDMRVNLLIATEGSVLDWDTAGMLDYRKPDGSKARFVDPADAMRYRFRKKPGLIDQIAGEVLSASGYDDEDVREVAAAEN